MAAGSVVSICQFTNNAFNHRHGMQSSEPSPSVPSPNRAPTLPPLPGNALQPLVVVGAPEVFTGWLFVFNYPDQCSDRECGVNDVGDTPARGGAYNFAGHIVGGTTINFAGHVSVGEETFVGMPLMNPKGAEIHLAVAPHGMVQPDLLPTQIVSPIGGPPHWWIAIFK